MLRALLAAAAVLAVAGCGSGSGDVTVPAYGEHPATTVSAAPADPAACRRDAVAFADAAQMFLAHSGPQAAYPADLYFVQLREALADFRARDCEPAVFRAALQRLSPPQRKQLVDGLPAPLADAVRRLAS